MSAAVGSWPDVTEYRLLFDSNPHPMWVFDSETLAFLAVNDAAVRLYGYLAGRVPGHDDQGHPSARGGPRAPRVPRDDARTLRACPRPR